MTKKERFEGVINYFKSHVPVAETELQYSNPFELLVAVILSAQCTDVRINKVTPKLFKDFPTPEVMAVSNSDVIFNYIRSVSYPNNKAKHLVGMANMLVNDFESTVPSEIDKLIKLPGVGRKTANVVASVVYDKPAMAVDTHVFRVSNRLGLTKATNPLQSEKQLIAHIPEQYIATAHHWLILHGRYTCMARSPKCESCPLTQWCNYFKTKVNKKNNPMAEKKVVIKKVIANSNIKQPFIPYETTLKVGDKAPNFKAINQYGEDIKLTDFKNKNVIIYFYPKDNTPGCTLEACSLRDDYNELHQKDYVILGVSADTEMMHKKFSDKFSLPFSLLADVDMAIIKAYDVWGSKQFMGKIYDGILRTTFIINKKGVISHVITKVKSKEHAQQILDII